MSAKRSRSWFANLCRYWRNSSSSSSDSRSPCRSFPMRARYERKGARPDAGPVVAVRVWSGPGTTRSEEHTSELQSRENLVCRLLLEKKKTEGNQLEHDVGRG